MKLHALLLMPLLLVAPAMANAQAAKPHDLEDFIRRQQFRQLKISPTGEYLAATVPVERKTALVILRRADNKVLAKLSIPGDRTQVDDFWWVNNERVLLTAAEKIGALEAPQPTGDLYGINFDGSSGGLLVGQSLVVDRTSSHIQPKQEGDVAADLVDDLPSDDKNAIISITPFTDDPYTRAERMNVYSGRRVTIAQAPVRNAAFVTDHAGNVRFAIGEDIEQVAIRLDGIDRGDAQPLQLGHVPQDLFGQHAEPRRAGQVGAVAREVHARQHNLGMTARDQRSHLLHHRPHRHRARIAAAEGNDAEGATMVAAILHLHEGPRQAALETVDEMRRHLLRHIGNRRFADRRIGNVVGQGRHDLRLG